MDLKQINTTQKLFFLLLTIACMLLMVSCGDGNSNSDRDADQTGNLSFNIVYHSSTSNHHPTAADIDCAGEGIDTVEASVYDSDDELVKRGGPWECEDGQGTITAVPVGNDLTVVIFGKAVSGNVVFRGHKSDVQVEADSPNDTGKIDCYAFAPTLLAPADEATVNADTVGLAWNPVAGATGYSVIVSENLDLKDPIIHETVETENYSPTGLSNSQTYYWQVLACDSYSCSGTETHNWSFTIDVQHQNTPPTVAISLPAEGATFFIDDMITFTGHSTDIEDGDLGTTSLVWRSDIDGHIGTGVTFDSDTLSEGAHQITLTARDSEGATETATLSITVNNPDIGCMGNEDPDTDCATCLPGWIDVDGNHCGTLLRYVDIDNHGRSDLDGMTWSTALSAVQDGIDTCQTELQANEDASHCEVWVAEGTYYIFQTANHNSVHLKTGVHVYGGFSGNETIRNQRNWNEHLTTLNGHMNEGSTERVEHVVLCEQEGLIDGFIITGGYSACDQVYYGGGGMVITANSRPVVRNTIFQNNVAECGTGGGVYIKENGTATLINCTFSDNEAEFGGGLTIEGSAYLRAENCVFQNNHSWSDGGAVINKGAHAVFLQCQFISNNGDSGGDAIHCSEHVTFETADDGSIIRIAVKPVLELDGCLITDHTEWASAVFLNQTLTTIKNSAFVNNTTTTTGAAVTSKGEDGVLDISNSYFYGNIASTNSDGAIGGGGVYCIDNQQATLTNCTIVGNQAISANPDNALGGGVYGVNTPITITNCIIRGNMPEQVNTSDLSATITHSNVTGISGYPVQNRNIDLPVYFASETDFHLLPHDPTDDTKRNPCIDAGNGDAAPSADFDGNPRQDDPQTSNTGTGTPGYVDMGAFEYQPE